MAYKKTVFQSHPSRPRVYPGRGASLTQMTYEIIQLQLLINAEHAASLEGEGGEEGGRPGK